jgi:hypothetical protein
MATESLPWKAALPTLADFKSSIPFMWHEKLQILLPKPSRNLLEKQQTRFKHDWGLVAAAFPEIPRDEFSYTWFIINTRTFYYVTPEMESYSPDDRLALLPIADLFNHADTGCRVSFSSDGFDITADRDYRAGEEIFISYGSHSNDFLLAEYGFILMENQWDKVSLDDVILPKLNETQKAQLEERGLLSSFMLDFNGLECHNTQMAARILSCTQEQWLMSVQVGGDDLNPCQQEADIILLQLLDELLSMSKKALEDITRLRVGEVAQRGMLELRWKQIQTTVTKSIERLKT